MLLGMFQRLCIILLFLLPLAAAQQCAQDDKKCELDHASIQDNSFLIEEAYNQEFGVVQHIQNWQRNWPGEDWVYTFTQEWPIDPAPRNQFSYTIPVVQPDELSGVGVGDVLINWRYQLVGSGDTKVAFAPRVSLVLPTGDWKLGRGAGTAGVQFNLPLSVKLGERFVTHWNAGATVLPSAKDTASNEAASRSANLGASLIFEASPRFNLMLETVYANTEVVTGPDVTEREHDWLISPGVRWSWNFGNGLQIVPGVAVPIGAGPSAGQYGVLLYLSLEHPYRKSSR
jgi:hypothetical protein